MTYHRSQSSANNKLRIAIAASEAVPWSKTGGLADVATALAKSLAGMGHDVTLFVPYHRQMPFVQANQESIYDSGTTIDVTIGERNVRGSVYWTNLHGSQPGSEPNAACESNVRVLLIDQPDYFDRPSLYQDQNGDYGDNCERFVFFSRAVLETCRKLVLRPDVIHANDWQTGLIPALLEAEQRGTPGFENTRCVFTIHNLAYQGWFGAHHMPLTGLDWKYFNWQQMECHDQLNLLKTGIAFADQVTTVSPTYADEIQTPEFGCGLEGFLAERRSSLTGILNGIDTDTWNPATDANLVANYDVDSVDTEKARCKQQLQERMGLPTRSDVPLFGMISRIADQKGFDLLTQSAQWLIQQDLQVAILGSGDPRYEAMLSELAAKHPDHVAAIIGFDEGLAHQIEAGSDFYLMPSRFEPCGLNQLYSLAYGTVPLVRAVGGLADSIVDATPVALAAGEATGIVFEEHEVSEFVAAMTRCLELYEDRAAFAEVRRTGMRRDSTWERSAATYLSVYRNAMRQELVYANA